MSKADKILKKILSIINTGNAVYFDNSGGDIEMTIMEYSKTDKEKKYVPHSHHTLGTHLLTFDEFIGALEKEFKIE